MYLGSLYINFNVYTLYDISLQCSYLPYVFLGQVLINFSWKIFCFLIFILIFSTSHAKHIIFNFTCTESQFKNMKDYAWFDKNLGRQEKKRVKEALARGIYNR